MPSTNLRDKERFDIDLEATYIPMKQSPPQQQCQITNLSSSGAKVHFPWDERFQAGTVIAMDIPIPNTLMRIAAEAEIMWTKQRFNEVISGMKFTDALSENMIQQFVNKSPQLSNYTELIW
jgi:hypothetical protein